MFDSPLLWLIVLVVGGGAFWLRRRRAQERDENFDRLRQILRQLGEDRPVSSVVFSDADGHFAELTPLLDRIAQELEAHRSRHREEQSRLETILGNMPDGVMVADTQHIVQTVNASFLTMFRLTADPCGKSVLHTLREAAFDALISTALKTGESQSAEIELSGSKPRRFIALHVTPASDVGGGPGIVAIFRDTSRIRQLEDVRREFVANVSHELRTPLSIFHGYVEMLTDNPEMDREAQAEVFEVLRRNSRRLNAILEDLLLLARLESRYGRLSCESIDVAAFFRGLAKDWELTTRERGQKIDASIPKGLPPLRADRLRLEQVMNNLMDNAVKYTDRGGTVAVRLQALGDQLEVRIEDTGRGIPPTDLPHIFERFYRADKARSREQGGTGLGLSIVKHIVQSHAGSVTAESTYGKGTAIIVRLPFAGPPAEGEKAG